MKERELARPREGMEVLCFGVDGGQFVSEDVEGGGGLSGL